MPRKHASSQLVKRNQLEMLKQDFPFHPTSQQPALQKKLTMDAEKETNKKNSNFLYFEKIQIKAVVKQLKQKGGLQRKKLLSLIDISENILKYQSNVLRLISPIIIVGDIHGQFFDLLNIFQQNGFPEGRKFLFLGDYVDRGLFCIEVITLLLVLKVKYPKNVLLLRGNHEGKVMTMNFNFRLQCEKKYGADIYEKFLEMFCKLPLCAVIDQTYFAVHGGISPQITLIKQLQKINRFVQIQNKGIVCDLVWSDPSQNTIIQWQPNVMRGCSYYYSKIQTKRFLKDNKIKLIIRGHEVQIQGYNYQKTSTDEKLTLTIFSAPNYCDTYKNKGAIAIVHNNKISIQRFSQVAHPFVLSNYMDCLQFSMPGVCQLVGKILIYLLKSKRTSKNSSMIGDHLLEQLDALKRIQIMTQLFYKKLLQNQEILSETSQNSEIQVTQTLAKSYEIAYQVFFRKKQQDQEQMYPNERILNSLQQIKKQRRKTMMKIKSPQRQKFSSQEQLDQVFGPKLQMKNNINKKIFFQQQVVVQERFQDSTLN